jgi:phosphohistidine swiveling domain-containing protein
VNPPAVHRGLGAAPGRAVGPARILRRPEDALDVPRGAVVVARMVHPHLAPLFFRIAAVVVEEGALLQHATTLAREFGIPAVVSLAGATEAFRDGERLEVRGDTGQVVRLDHTAPADQ